VHAILFQHGLRAPVDDLFGVGGRRFLERCQLSEPWRSNVAASLYLIDVLEEQIDGIERELRSSAADHRYLQLLMSAPGIGWVLGYTIAAEIGRCVLAERQRARLGRQRGGSVAAITIARKLAEASWWMLTRNRPFAPAGARVPLTA
jgi:transposase